MNTSVPELEYLGRLKSNHYDLLDHPMIASLIWMKWQKVRPIFVKLFWVKVLQHLCGFMFTFGWFVNANCSPNSTYEFNTFAYCHGTKIKPWKYLFMAFSLFNAGYFFFLLASMIRKSLTNTLINFKKVFLRNLVVIATLIVIVIMLSLPSFTETGNPNPNKRDVAGLYILFACFDIFLGFRVLLRDRNKASMITWTMVVSESMLKFILVRNGLPFFFLNQF